MGRVPGHRPGLGSLLLSDPTPPAGPALHPVHPLDREAALRAMASAPVDLLVVGGGITGAGVARDAALRGLRVALVEKEDFGSGTSSRSSKIVHGGVRYLEYLQLGLVRESARERRILRRIAPHLVHPLPFLYPVFAGESLLKIRAGLRLFDLFSGNDASERSRRLGPDETRERLPGLRDPLKGSVLYPEYITDDARLTLANITSAAAAGAMVANHAKAEALLVEEGRVVGARIRTTAADGGWPANPPANAPTPPPREEARTLEVRAAVTVNATGPWVPELFAGSGARPPHAILPSKGIHILLEHRRLPLRAATFLRSSTGRRGLAMPRGGWVYVGTSDEVYRDDLDRPRARHAEVEELVEMVRDCFPESSITLADVRATWAGIRPLVAEEGKDTRDMSRHDQVWDEPAGLVTVAGGKLTTYRPMARRILAAVERTRGHPLPPEPGTDRIPLTGAPPEPIDVFRARTGEALRRAGVEAVTRDRIAFLYGTEIETFLAWGREDPTWLEPPAPGCPALRAEIRHGVEHEMALTLTDLLDRRMALLLFSPDGGLSAAPEAARLMGERLGWSTVRREAELHRYAELVRTHGPLGEDTATDPPTAGPMAPHAIDTPSRPR